MYAKLLSLRRASVLSASTSIASSPPGVAGGGSGDGGRCARTSGFALYSNIIGIFVTDLVDDSVPDMVVPADILAFNAGAMKEMHGICCEANPPIAPAQNTTLRVADVQGRRRSQ